MVDEPVRTVCDSDLMVIADPTCKGTCTGLLEVFLDHFPPDALHGVTALPVMTTDSPAHALAVEVSLRPLLVEPGRRARPGTRGPDGRCSGPSDGGGRGGVSHRLAGAATPSCPLATSGVMAAVLRRYPTNS